MEALNLAAAWRLPVVFVCKDNRWAVSTRSDALTGGGLRRRLRAFGVPVVEVDGRDVERVDRAARRAVARGRAGAGPTLLLARCARLEGHFLGDPLVRLTSALGELVAQVRPLVGQLRTQPGAPVAHRVGALSAIGRRAATLALERPGRGRQDPLRRAARRLPPEVAAAVAAKARRGGRACRAGGPRRGGRQCLGRRSPRRSTVRWRSRCRATRAWWCSGRTCECCVARPTSASGATGSWTARSASRRSWAPRSARPWRGCGRSSRSCSSTSSASRSTSCSTMPPRSGPSPGAGGRRPWWSGPRAEAATATRASTSRPCGACWPASPAWASWCPPPLPTPPDCCSLRSRIPAPWCSSSTSCCPSSGWTTSAAPHATRSPSTSRQRVRTATSRTSRHRSRSGGRRRAGRAATSP